MVGKAQKSHGAKSELNSVFGLEKVDQWNPIRTSVIQCRSRPMRFLGFCNHEKGAPGQEISKRSTGLQHVFEKWGELCKKYIVFQWRYFGKDRHRTFTKFRLGVIR
jgi:hypothetical protein